MFRSGSFARTKRVPLIRQVLEIFPAEDVIQLQYQGDSLEVHASPDVGDPVSRRTLFTQNYVHISLHPCKDSLNLFLAGIRYLGEMPGKGTGGNFCLCGSDPESVAVRRIGSKADRLGEMVAPSSV